MNNQKSNVNNGINNSKEFISRIKRGEYKDFQPNYESFERLGALDDYIFQALFHMGSASHQMSWANTVIEDMNNIPKELKREMVQVTRKISEVQSKLRELKYGE